MSHDEHNNTQPHKDKEHEKGNPNKPVDNNQVDSSKDNNKPFDKEQWNERVRNAPGHDPEHFKDKQKKQ